ncbi:MAG: tRNA (guanosine(37)-N1)-methyltransferase TrmD [Acidaminococcaceae bacterium]|nr:tRNA (guanosine(37)-N1)-methyltransferase TrmD [Acidaminococcaceae bacterium]
MKFIFLSLFPEFIEQAGDFSILGRGRKAGLFELSVINPRDYTTDRHRSADDTPCGGGAGMVLKPEPFSLAIDEARKTAPEGVVIALTPGGRPLTQNIVKELAAGKKDLIFVCGHYEGFDQRILDKTDLQLSVGDYVVTGGELPALIIMDAVARYIPGVLGKEASTEEESFSDYLLEYPQYTRPVDYQGAKVPEVLLSGNHAAIKKWRRKEAIRATYKLRPDLLSKLKFDEEDGKLFLEVLNEEKTTQSE